MKQAIYTIGSEDYSTWITRNEGIEHLVITGSASFEDMSKLAGELEYKEFHLITLQDVNVKDESYVREFDGRAYTISYWHHMASRVCDDELGILPLEKMYLNTSGTTDFLVENGSIYSKDKTTLIHMEPVPQVLEFGSSICYIGHFAFAGLCQIESVVFQEGLKSIGAYAFASVEDLACIALPDTITELGEGAFHTCDIETLKLSANLKEIPDKCFQYNELEEIEIPSSVKSIGNSAFHCGYLEKVIIPEGVERIGYDVFGNLLQIELPSTLKTIAPDFYYEEPVDDNCYPPYVKVSPLNPIFYSKDGSLYFRENDKIALDHAYNGTQYW